MWGHGVPGSRRVRRPRLTARVADAGVVVLEAPSGYGKTSLAIELAEDADALLVVVSLPDAAGGDEGPRLAATLHRALDRAGVAHRGHDIAGAAAAIEAAALRRPVLVLLDEAQRAGPESADLARRIAGSLPSPPHKVVVCGRRVSMTWPDGLSVERLGADDLAFTADEASELLGPDGAADATSIVAALDGWPAAIALLSTGRVVPSLGAVARDQVLDELVSGLLAGTGDAGRRSLAVGARLPIAGPRLLDAASGAGSWDALVETGVPMAPAPGGWWRMSEPVRRSIERLAPVTAEAAARAEAALVGAGLVAEALDVALASGRPGAAFDLIEALGSAELEQLAPAELRAALWAAGPDHLACRPRARLQLARLLSFAGDIVEYEALLDELAVDAVDSEDVPLALAIDAERVCDLARQAQVDEARRLGAAVLAAAIDPRTRATCLAGLGLAEAGSGEPGSGDRALRHLTESAALYGHLHDVHLQARALQWRGYGVRYRNGDLDRAVEDLRRSRDLLEPGDRRRANLATFLGEVLLRSGRTDEADEVVLEAHRVGQVTGDPLTIAYAAWVAAEVATQRGDAVAVERHLAEVERHRGDWWEHSTGSDFLAAGCEMWRRLDRPEVAAGWAARAEGREDGSAPTLSVARAALLAAAGAPPDAIEAIDAVLRVPSLPPIEVPRLRLLRARARQRGGDGHGAAADRDQAIAEALALGQAVLDGLRAMEGAAFAALGASPPAAAASGPAVATTHVSLLGGFRARRGEEPLDIPPGHAVLLVALVATARRPLLVDEVVDLLWEEGDADTGRRRLRNLLHRLRERAGDLVVRRGDTLVLVEDAEVDVVTFRALAVAALAAAPGPDAVVLARDALDGYGGELLPEHRYDDAVAAERERLAALHLQLLDRLVTELERSGDLVAASDARLAAAAADPWDESRLLAAADAAAIAGRPRVAAALVERARVLAAELSP
jgi:DNA-binding SARP family transcriptional activator/ATP/maltotriose-dependent transcriptional regulator MalT